MNKASGDDGIPVELFHILKDDAVKAARDCAAWTSPRLPVLPSVPASEAARRVRLVSVARLPPSAVSCRESLPPGAPGTERGHRRPLVWSHEPLKPAA